MTRATVITDASFCPNGKLAGWAAWVRIDGIADPITASGPIRVDCLSASQAELFAAINGAWLAKQYGATSALLQTDCLLIVHLAMGEIKKRNLISDWNCALERAGLTGFPISGRHVKGHTRKADARSYVNRWCDRNARKEMRKLRRAA